MTVRVGIVGLGFMGKVHYETYAKLAGAKVVAVCDVDAKKRAGDWSGIAGNIGGAGARVDLSGVSVHARLEDLLADPSVDVVDITLPTPLHAAAAARALAAGKHVICEKPMARTSREAAAMIAAAKKARRLLFVAHCIRFWPAYAAARDLLKGGRHGRVLSAVFRRVSATPRWSWRNWLQDPAQSGLCALDLHIHDADFVLHCFGAPRSVSCAAAGFRRGRLDHVVASYDFGGNRLVAAEGAWEYAPAFPFSMTFAIAMEKATLVLGADGALRLHPLGGGAETVAVPPGDGYQHELAHFVDCVARGRLSDVVPPESALASVKLIECEVRSARTGRPVRVRL